MPKWDLGVKHIPIAIFFFFFKCAFLSNRKICIQTYSGFQCTVIVITTCLYCIYFCFYFAQYLYANNKCKQIIINNFTVKNSFMLLIHHWESWQIFPISKLKGAGAAPSDVSGSRQERAALLWRVCCNYTRMSLTHL